MHRNIFGYILCVVFRHIFLLDIFSLLYLVIFPFFDSNFTLYIPLRHNQDRYKEEGNKKVQRPDLIEGDIDL